MSEEPRGGRLHDAYGRLVRDAVDRGLVAKGGRTPREIEADLVGVEALSAPDVSRLREIVESCVYGHGHDDGGEGLDLCARLSAAIAPLPLVHRSGSVSSQRTSVPRWLIAGPVLAGLCALLVFAAPRIEAGLKREPLSPAPSGRSWHETGALSGQSGEDERWVRPRANATVTEVMVPSDLDSENTVVSAGLDTDTGSDHTFRGFRDPFDPPLGAHHRTNVYTHVGADYRFRQVNEGLVAVRPVWGPDWGRRYLAEVFLNARSTDPMPIPTPSPEALLTRLEWKPWSARLTVHRGPGGALWVRFARPGRYRVRYTFRVRPDYHFAPLPAVPTEELTLSPMDLPKNVRQDAAQVIEAIGQLPGPTYRDTVLRLHAYFNGFEVSPILRKELRKNSYLTVALARKGVCRHRARTFVITANAVGIPARLIENEIHSFAEVQLPDGHWRLIELREGDGGWRPAWNEVPKPTVSVFTVIAAVFCLMAIMLCLAWAHRRDSSEHRIDRGGRVSRAHRRAARDRQLRSGRAAVTRLRSLTRRRLESRLGLAPGGTDDLAGRLEAEAPEMVWHWVALEEGIDTVGRGDAPRYGLLEAYWHAKTLLIWAREGERRERQHARSGGAGHGGRPRQ
jgi:Transglutaminase-like superfamily